MLVNEYRQEIQFEKVRKVRNINNNSIDPQRQRRMSMSHDYTATFIWFDVI